MIGRIRRWLTSLLGGEAKQQQREIVELAGQARVYPDNERLILRLGDCYLRAEDKERALSAYWHVVDLYKKRQDWQKAAAVLKRILLLAPAEMIARFELAHCFEKLERRREAAQQWQQAGGALKASDDLDGALRCFQRAIDLDPLAKHLVAEIVRLQPAPKSAPVPKTTPVPKSTPVPKTTPVPEIAPAPKSAPVPKLAPLPPQVRPNLASLGRAQVRDELAPITTLDNPLDGFDLGVDAKATTEYAAEELGTLLQDDFDAETVAVESLPAFDEEHRPADTPIEPAILSP
jgi:tetratricopeptide (TPR) repeat protein